MKKSDICRPIHRPQPSPSVDKYQKQPSVCCSSTAAVTTFSKQQPSELIQSIKTFMKDDQTESGS